MSLQTYLLGIIIGVALVSYTTSQAVSICDVKKVTASSGEITTPNYPDDYGNNRDCSLVIDGGPNSKISITFQDIGIEEYEDIPGSCLSDAIIINGKRYCGYDLPPQFVTKGNTVSLRFVSDSSNIYDETGFKISYLITKVAPQVGKGICPGRFIKNRLSGSFYSPNYPLPYPDGRNCKVTVYVPDNYQMNVWFKSFHLQRSVSCLKDWMVVSDEHGGMRMCGGGKNKLPKPHTLTGRNVKLRFRSDSTITQKGFHLEYNMTKLTEGSCICTKGLEYLFVHDFKPKILRSQHTIEFNVKTSQSRGLILFSQGRLRDYIYIYIRYGRVFYETDLGTGYGRTVSVGPLVNDNRWHKVLIKRKDRSLRVSVDDRLSGSASTRGAFNRLDIPDAVGFFLGSPSTISGLTRNFYGCIRDLRIDGREPITNAFAMKPDYWVFGKSRLSKCKE